MEIIDHNKKKYKLQLFNSLDECIKWCLQNKPIVKPGYSIIDEAKSSDHYLPTIAKWWREWKKATLLKDEEEAFENWCIDNDNDTDYNYNDWERFHWLDGYNYAKKKFLGNTGEM